MLVPPRLPWTRLIVADPGLIDSLGHHLGYSYAVAAASEAAGVPALILAGRGFRGEVGSVPLRPILSSRYPTAARPDRLRATVYGVASALPAPLAHIIAQGARAARRALRRSVCGDDALGSELARELSMLPDASRALLLLHTASSAHLASLPKAVAPRAIGRIAVVLRRTQEEMDITDGAAVPIGQVLHTLRAHFGAGLVLFADTEELAAQYQRLVGEAVRTVPLPVVAPPIRAEPAKRTPHLVFAGGARAEKGYGSLPGLIEALGSQVCFTIHSGPATADTDPIVQRVHRVLRRLAGPSVRLLECSLAPEAYQNLIASADLLLLPYDARAYGPRSSGILAEARAMGVPAVVPAGTWMAASVGPDASLVFRDPADLPCVVAAALADLANISARYRAAASEWRERHNPEALFQTLANPQLG